MGTLFKGGGKIDYAQDLLHSFWEYLSENDIEIYNEFSLQYELGIYLRANALGYNAQFKRIISYFYNRVRTCKHEIDIVIFKPNMSEKYAIKLKFPRRGQYPEQMFKFIEDIRFIEEIKTLGFNDTFAMTVADDHNFYSGKYASDDIYRFFKGRVEINGTITKPTGSKEQEHTVRGTYYINWQQAGEFRYYILKMQ